VAFNFPSLLYGKARRFVRKEEGLITAIGLLIRLKNFYFHECKLTDLPIAIGFLKPVSTISPLFVASA